MDPKIPFMISLGGVDIAPVYCCHGCLSHLAVQSGLLQLLISNGSGRVSTRVRRAAGNSHPHITSSTPTQTSCSAANLC